MKKMISFFSVLVFFISTTSQASCNWSTDITPTEKGFVYTEACHKKVGLMVKNLEDMKIEIQKLNLSLEYKDALILKQDQRIELWRKTTYELEDKMLSFEKWKTWNNWLYFGAGIGIVILSIWGVGTLIPLLLVH